MSIKKGLFWCFFVLIISACDDEPGDFDVQYLKEYFPLHIGAKWTYQVDSIEFDRESNFQTRDSVSLIVEETITDTFRDTDDHLVYLIERRQRPVDSSEWQLIRIWNAYTTNYEAIRHEENLDFVKLVFPLHVGSDWDGNKYFPENIQIPIHGELLEVYKYWHYYVQSINKPEHIGNFDFEKVLKVLHVDEDNLLERRYSFEQYAFGVGLVYKEEIILDSQCNGNPIDCIDQTWEQKADKGYILRQTILSYE